MRTGADDELTARAVEVRQQIRERLVPHVDVAIDQHRTRSYWALMIRASLLT